MKNNWKLSKMRKIEELGYWKNDMIWHLTKICDEYYSLCIFTRSSSNTLKQLRRQHWNSTNRFRVIFYKEENQ